MSDASNHASISTSGYAIQSDDPVVDEEVSAAPWESHLWVFSCALASIGALMFCLSTWMPWITVTGTPSTSSTSISSLQLFLYHLDPGDIAGWAGLFGTSLLSIA